MQSILTWLIFSSPAIFKWKALKLTGLIVHCTINDDLLSLLTYGPGDIDVVLALRQRICEQCFSIVSSPGVMRCCEQSSQILSSHFFFGLPLSRCPCSSNSGNLSLPIQFTWPKYVSLLTCNKSTMSFSTDSSFTMSTFFLLSLLVIPQILVSADISNTLNFILWFSVPYSPLQSQSCTGRLTELAFRKQNFRWLAKVLSFPHLMQASHNTSCKSYTSSMTWANGDWLTYCQIGTDCICLA